MIKSLATAISLTCFIGFAATATANSKTETPKKIRKVASSPEALAMCDKAAKDAVNYVISIGSAGAPPRLQTITPTTPDDPSFFKTEFKSEENQRTFTISTYYDAKRDECSIVQFNTN